MSDLLEVPSETTKCRESHQKYWYELDPRKWFCLACGKVWRCENDPS